MCRCRRLFRSRSKKRSTAVLCAQAENVELVAGETAVLPTRPASPTEAAGAQRSPHGRHRARPSALDARHWQAGWLAPFGRAVTDESKLLYAASHAGCTDPARECWLSRSRRRRLREGPFTPIATAWHGTTRTRPHPLLKDEALRCRCHIAIPFPLPARLSLACSGEPWIGVWRHLCDLEPLVDPPSSLHR